MSEKTAINATYSGTSQEAVNGFAGLLRENVTHETFWHQVHEKMVRFGNGTTGSYWMGQASIVVEAKSLNNSLVQAEAVKYGLIPNADTIMQDIFTDCRFEIATDEEAASVVPLVETNKYLLNKVQELSRAIEILEKESYTLTRLCEGYDSQINALNSRYAEQHAFLHSFIDFGNLMRVVRATAEKVDDALLDNYPLHKIH